jgi:hypothetical protein
MGAQDDRITSSPSGRNTLTRKVVPSRTATPTSRSTRTPEGGSVIVTGGERIPLNRPTAYRQPGLSPAAMASPRRRTNATMPASNKATANNRRFLPTSRAFPSPSRSTRVKIATTILRRTSSSTYPRAQSHLFDYPWIPASAGMTDRQGLACVRRRKRALQADSATSVTHLPPHRFLHT